MKKIIILLVFFSPLHSYTQVIDSISEIIAKEIINNFNNLPKDDTVKVVFSYLFFDNNTQTQLTADLSRKISNDLITTLQKLQNKTFVAKFKNIIFIPNTSLYNQFNSSIRKEAIIPDGQNHSDYWANYKKNSTPDFYIYGSFSLDINRRKFSINEFLISPNTYNGKYKNHKNISVHIDPIELDVDELNSLVNKNISLNPKSVFDEFLSLTGTFQSPLFEAELYRIDINGNISETIKNYDTINSNDIYQIKINMLDKAFLYVFYFDIEDTLNDPHIYFLSENSSKFNKGDKINIPNSIGFRFNAPLNQNLHNSIIRIKIIASQSIFIDSSSVLSRDNTKDLLKNLPPNLFFSKDITVIRP